MKESGPDDYVRIHVWVKGRVQGVGFRSFVQECGVLLNLTGWVRNVGDDMLETIAEGPHVVLEQFVQSVRIGPRIGRVDETRVEWETACKEFLDFRVRNSA